MNTKKENFAPALSPAQKLSLINKLLQLRFLRPVKLANQFLESLPRQRGSESKEGERDTSMYKVSNVPPLAGRSVLPEDVNKGAGTKYDDGKPLLALCPTEGIRLMGQAMTYGAKKYGAHNYLGGITSIRLLSACLRHVTAYIAGEDNDGESGISHIGHALACLAMLAEMNKRKPELDDRHKGA